MSSYSDEPVLLAPTARNNWKRWVAILAALAIAAIVIYIPVSKDLLDERAHDAKRGERQGVITDISVDGTAHTIELTWANGHLAPILKPAPAPDAQLHVSGRFGKESLTWNATLGAFGPTTAEVDPYSHYEVSLRLENAGKLLWSDTLWAYGIVEGHNH